MKEQVEILVYITDNPEAIKSGNPLCLCMKDSPEREQILVDIARALRANVVKLKNGDSMIVSNV